MIGEYNFFGAFSTFVERSSTASIGKVGLAFTEENNIGNQLEQSLTIIFDEHFFKN